MNTAPSSMDRQDRPAGAERVALLGHDLRATMSDVIGGLRLIDGAELAPEARLQFERVRAASESLARLIEQELLPLQGEAGLGDPAGGNLHLHRFFNDLKMRWAGRAHEKGLEFEMQVADDVPKVLCIERIGLERIASNLLSNAVKYTDKGGVRLLVNLVAPQTLSIAIEDDGPGISDAALKSLFVEGARPDGRGKPGLGLGLTIARDLAERLGGGILVADRPPGTGALVTALLPFEPWEPHYPVAEPGGIMPDLSKVRVLVADDSPTNQAVIGNMLSMLGAEYVTASDGVEAMNWLDREHFDIVLLDIEMPRLSGMDVLREVRKRPGCAGKIPILAISAYVLRSNREAIYAAGADGILAKPVVSLQSFWQALERVLLRHKRARDEEEPLPREVLASDGAAMMDVTRFDHLMKLSGPVGAVELLERLTKDLKTIERGLVQGFFKRSFTDVRSHTHVLISVAGAVGAEQLHRKAQALNELAHLGSIDPVLTLGQEVLPMLDQLIQFVAEERDVRRQPQP